MKPRKLNKKLSLNKKTVVDLSGSKMNNVKGGTNTAHTMCWGNTCYLVCETHYKETCVTCDPTCQTCGDTCDTCNTDCFTPCNVCSMTCPPCYN